MERTGIYELGYSLPELMKLPIGAGFGKDRTSLLHDVPHSVLSMESLFRCADGSTVPVDLQLACLLSMHKACNLSARDITPRKYAGDH